jgi:isopenicillin N synthase-like dioxygenase
MVRQGDMLQRWTNDVLKANPHQVVELPSKSNRTVIPERYSIAFFCNANKDTLLECLEQCVSEERPPKYPPILAVDYITQRLTDTIDNNNA